MRDLTSPKDAELYLANYARSDGLTLGSIHVGEPMIGKEVAQRFRPVFSLGNSTGPSRVFVAEDLVERRRVALRVVQTGGLDTADLARLETSLEPLVGLEHRNVVRLYGWGVDQQSWLLYTASELCDGGSLSRVARAGVRLTPSQALVVALDAARGLEYLHDRNLVVGELRSSKLLLSASGGTKIEAVDLERLLTELGIEPTEWPRDGTPGSKIGESAVSESQLERRALRLARYASPEKARGLPLDGRSDVYSLALILNETISGELPHVEETALGTLMSRVEHSVEICDEAASLRPCLERCGRLDKEERPESGELAIALLAAAESMPRPAPLPLPGLELHTPQDSQVGGTAEAVEGNRALVNGDVPVPIAPELVVPDVTDFDEPLPVSVPGIEPQRSVAAGFGSASVPEVYFEARSGGSPATPLDVPLGRSHPAELALRHDDDLDDEQPQWAIAVAVAVAAAALVTGFFFYFNSGAGAEREVPDLTGQQFDDLDLLISGSRWEVERLDGRRDGSSAGTIIDQDPQSGARLSEGETLRVTVSLGNELVDIPITIAGLTVSQAQVELESAGLTLGTMVEEHNEIFESSLVIGHTEPVGKKPKGAAVSVAVSLGPAPRTVPPDLVGKSIAEATELLAQLRIGVEEERVFDEAVEEGTVISSEPAPGAPAAADSQVKVVVSAGRAPVAIPDLFGVTFQEAFDALDALGFVLADTRGSAGQPVVATEPPFGAEIVPGSEVIVVLGNPDEVERDQDSPADE